MSITSILISSIFTLVGPPNQDMWSFSATSSGSDFSWTAPSPINPNGDDYEMLYTITGATVMVSYIGIQFGPIDVMDMVTEDVIDTWRAAQGPAPVDFGWISVVFPVGQNPPSMSYDWLVEIDTKGNTTFQMENLYLGISEYDLGWPWGTVSVNLESGTITADLGIASVTPPCYADINNDTVVDVVDLLEIIGNWGYCHECMADINRDSLVDVTDLLELVGSWGSCP